MFAEVTDEDVEVFLANLDPYPLHWLLHFAHACEIVGYKHPQPLVRFYWSSLYDLICCSFHMEPEKEEDLDLRLQDEQQVEG